VTREVNPQLLTIPFDLGLDLFDVSSIIALHVG
jgi:hypothetical protein